MARIPSTISTALLRLRLCRPSPLSPFSLLSFRHRSSSSNQGSLSELDLSSSSSSSSPSTSSSSSSDDTEAIGLRKLEEAVHAIMVMKSTPDWIPFIPGSCFWVPPRKRPIDVEELLGKLAATAPSFEDDSSSSSSSSLSVTTAGGWPCFEVLLAQQDGAYPQPGQVKVEVEVEVEVSNHDKLEVKVLSTSETSGSGDKEG